MSSKDRFEKTFSRKKKETTATAAAAAATTTTTKKSNDGKNINGEKQPKSKSKQKHPPKTETPSSKTQDKIIVSKPIKITFKCKEQPQQQQQQQQPTKEKKKPEKDEILNKEKKEKKKKRKSEDENVGEKKEDLKKIKVKVGKNEANEKDKLDEDEGLECAFATARITKIVKSDGFDSKITAEAVFLINKATEKFIELFSEDAYGYAVEERKNFVGYKHLSSVVSKGKMFDFLSDFVPEKVTAKKALAERNPPQILPG
ncbi:hypothetical protein RND81_11G097300 [Saponaria officinalis]|uniref:Transcription factor CBF/NF-Y/archaeal histone domain-containing protein n=1 Tax=Saponaria officinalis TaxID=3572 RepID=A0AAW1HKJ0_SAPOF